MTSTPRVRRGGREFQPDEAGAHDHESPTGSQRALQALGVVEGAQVVHELRARSGNRNRAGTPAGGEQHRVGGDRCLPVEFDATRRRVDPHDGGSGHDLDVVAVQPLLRQEQQRLAVLAAGEELLRQRRTLVGGVWLVADQHDPPVESSAAQVAGGDGGGLARSDRHEGPAGHEWASSVDVVAATRLARGFT